MQTLKPADTRIQLRKEEATLLLLAFEAGALHLDTFNVTATNILGMKGNVESHKQMMEKLVKLQKNLVEQIYPKNPIIKP